MRFPFWIEFDPTLFWYPYFMYGKYRGGEADYYGREWFLMISIWIVEITIFRN